jgi:hypothetical protein
LPHSPTTAAEPPTTCGDPIVDDARARTPASLIGHCAPSLGTSLRFSDSPVGRVTGRMAAWVDF